MKLQRIPALLLAAVLSAQAAPPQKAELPRYPAPKNLDFAQVAGSLHTITVNGQSGSQQSGYGRRRIYWKIRICR